MLTSSRRSRLSLVKEYRRCLESRGNSQHVGEPRTLTKLTVLSTCIGCQKLKGDHRNTTDSGLWSVQVIRPPGPSSSLTGEEIHFGHKNRPQRPSGGVPPGRDSNAAETARCGPSPRRKAARNPRNGAPEKDPCRAQAVETQRTPGPSASVTATTPTVTAPAPSR